MSFRIENYRRRVGKNLRLHVLTYIILVVVQGVAESADIIYNS